MTTDSPSQAPVQNRQLFAWLVLIACFAACVLVTVSIPAGYRLYTQRATLPMAMIASPSGRLMLNSRETLSARQEVDLPATIETARLFDSGVIEFFDPAQQSVRSLMTVSGRSVVTIESAKEPRFDTSTAASQLDLLISRGRVRIRVLDEGTRTPLQVRVRSAFGTVTTGGAGDFSFEVTDDGLQLSVLDGRAQLASDGGVMELAAGERASVAADATLDGPYSTARNLIRNGDFADELNGWFLFDWNIEREDQPTGETMLADMRGEPVLRFEREGIGAAANEIRQVIDATVLDYNELQLRVSLIIHSQTLPVCGGLGSECPLTIRIDYEDAAGGNSTWEQGIYAIGEPSTDSQPPFCISCNAPLNRIFHWKATRIGELVAYESDNLMTSLAIEESFRRPVQINAISIIAEGHGFKVDVVDIALIAHE